jgi:hypothetical protein
MNATQGNAPDRWQRTEARGLQQQRPIYTPTAGRPYSGRRLPPYGLALREVLNNPASWPGRPGTSADGSAVTVWVLAGADCWNVAELWAHPREAKPPLFVLSPPGEDPALFDWSALRGHPPTLLRPCPDLSQVEVAALVAALLRDGAGRALVLGDTPRLYTGGEATHA